MGNSSTRIATDAIAGAELNEAKLTSLWAKAERAAELKSGLGNTFIVNLFYFCIEDFKTYICGGTKKKWY
jgi:hypothetical protein